MPVDPARDYKEWVLNNLPSDVTVDPKDGFFIYNNHKFPTWLQTKWYRDYIRKYDWLNIPQVRIYNSEYTIFQKNGEDWVQVEVKSGDSYLESNTDVQVQYAFGGAGASGGSVTGASPTIRPGGSAGGQLKQGNKILKKGKHTFSLSVGGSSRSGQGPGNTGNQSSWTEPDNTITTVEPGGYAGAFGTGVDANKYVGGIGGGGGMCGSSSAYNGGAAFTGGFVGGKGFHSTTASERSGGGGAGAGGPGLDGTLSNGGNGGAGVLLDWLIDPTWVCAGAGGSGNTPGTSGNGATNTTNTASSVEATYGSASGSVINSGASGKGGDAFLFLQFKKGNLEIKPVEVNYPDLSSVTYWGSSSAQYSGIYFNSMISTLNSNGVAEGKASERLEETLARLGSHPFKLVFPNNTIPASGTVTVTVDGGNPPSINVLKSYTGIANGIRGSLQYVTDHLEWTREKAGSEVVLTSSVVFVPTLSFVTRKSPIVLWLGKNNLTSSIQPNNAQYILDMHKQVLNYLLPVHKKFVVIGQFSNTGWTEATVARDRVNEVNRLLKQEYPEQYVDVIDWMRDDATWARLGLTKTSDDIAQLALGNLPSSLAGTGGTDTQHFSGAAYKDFVDYPLKAKCQEVIFN